MVFTLLHVFIFAQDTGSHQKIHDTGISKKLNDTGIRKELDDTITGKTNKMGLHDTITGRINKNVTAPEDSGLQAPVKKMPLKRDSASAIAIKPGFTNSLQKDSLTRDTVKPAPVKIAVAKKDTVAAEKIRLMAGTEKTNAIPDEVFYVLVFILFFLALIKAAFPKYFGSIFTLSFQATFRQTQTREQMAQNFFPAFMLNILFALSGGVFITLYAGFEKWAALSFWELFVSSTAILLLAYSIKYLVISFTGWVFNSKEAAMEYRFVVFLINKLLGILVIPFLFLIAYSDNKIKTVAITIVLCLLIFSLAVRYIVSLARIRKNLSVTAFHFFLYLCAVEIIPLLVIYKVLFEQTSSIR
ncbi:MAG: DUF4271 domain-containing protein [Parafilimonas sp.]